MLSDKHLEHFCLLGESDRQCRYLAEIDKGNKVIFSCLKKTKLRSDIDNEVKEAVRSGLSAALPVGDNCGGYLHLPNILQGYDVKNP